ncbi:MAG: tetratricopeptide repeat protein [Gammaproteobacteria bacterium]|nr:tetratricopeptide repeat protein [Gammaproteobacteria bacterium]MBU1645902.1 tetratricopeptide repeat protein [Gammaproteobacteria bacterium]MBU1971964.1 tetratricopeptide repeat protein [Gammaproteobacteria bacterium]
MSLVNKMLRDLDARRAGDAERGVLPMAVTAMEAEVRVPRSRIATLFAIAITAAGGVAVYLGYMPAADPPPAVVATVVPAALPAPAPLLAPSQAETAPATAAPSPVPGGMTPAAAAPTPAVVSAEPPAITAKPPRPDLSFPDLLSPSLKLDAIIDSPPAAARPANAKPPLASKSPPAPAPAPKVPLPAVEKPPTEPVRAVPEPQIEKQVRLPSAADKAEAEFRRGQIAQRQGAADDATARYRAALAEQVEHIAARQGLAGLLIERRRFDEAEEVLRGGRALFPQQPFWPMTLARLKVERGEAAAALDILSQQAAAGEASADFLGFHGALLQRFGRTAEAAERYAAATRLAPNEARWWAGMGIALEGGGRAAEARSAFERARSLPGLPAELAAHVEQRLRAR